MSSGSLKDLTKALATFFPHADYPLPDDLVATINAYIAKHATYDDSDSQRLHDELLSLFHSEIQGKPKRYPAFIAVLRLLRPNIRDAARLVQWWDVLILPLLTSHGQIKALVEQSEGIILDALTYDAEDDKSKDTADASTQLAERLVQLWLDCSSGTLAQKGYQTQYMESRVRPTLLAFGRKRPRNFLMALNTFFVKRDHRAHVLSLLGEFVRSGPPHLHQVLETPLFRNLLKCLSIDTSTTVVSLAISTLTMFLPHFPVSLANYLPMVFNIYTRLLFWERQHAVPSRPITDVLNEKKTNLLEDQTDDDGSWEKLHSSDLDEEAIPELLQYFTFLYGLYPINFMSYIRKPQKYLRHANFPGAEDLDIEPSEIRARSEPFRQLHLLHPNFFHLTIESEISGSNRWMKSDASDVVAECMGLCSPILTESLFQSNPSGAGVTEKKYEPDGDVPSESLLDGDNDEMEKPSETPGEPPLSTSWRNTQSTAVGSIGSESVRKASLARSALSGSESPMLAARDTVVDSPTLPPQMMLSSPPNHLQDLLNSQRSIRSSLHQSIGGESVHSLPLTQSAPDSSANVDTYLQSLSNVPPSPSLRPVGEGANNVAALQREILLLRNDLNFERYLKQQHLAHIGQLRRKQVKEATVEAETQNLINANKVLRSKLDDAKRSAAQLKKEFEKSRNVSRKWESDLGSKLRTIKEDLKKSKAQCETLEADLAISRQNADNLKQLVVKSESKDMETKQKLQVIETDLSELEELKEEMAKINKVIKAKETMEKELKQSMANEQAALSKLEVLQTRLTTSQADFERLRLELGSEIVALRKKLETAEDDFRSQRQNKYQAMLDKSLASYRTRLMELQEAHARLLQNYTELQARFYEETADRDPDTPLLSSDTSQTHSVLGSRFETPSSGNRRHRPHALSDPENFDIRSLPSASSHDFSTSNSPPRVRPSIDGQRAATIATSQPRSTSPHSATSSDQIHTDRHNRQVSFDGEVVAHDSSSIDTNSFVKPRIQPQSEVRVYGRGGVQNIGKKKDKRKEDESKGKRILGMRGIRGLY